MRGYFRRGFRDEGAGRFFGFLRNAMRGLGVTGSSPGLGDPLELGASSSSAANSRLRGRVGLGLGPATNLFFRAVLFCFFIGSFSFVIQVLLIWEHQHPGII